MRIARATMVLPLALSLSCLGVGRKPVGEVHLPADAPEPGPAFGTALYQTVGARLQAGNEIHWVNNGKVFDAAVEEIGKAKKSINIATFIWSDSDTARRLTRAIAARTRAGVACRILVDAVGSLSFSEKESGPLEDAGCAVRKFRPIPGQDDLARNHRKIIVVDGRVGITGGFGIDDKWRGRGKKEATPGRRGTVVGVSGDYVLVDYGAKSEGVIPSADLLDAEGKLSVQRGDIGVDLETHLVFFSLLEAWPVRTKAIPASRRSTRFIP